MTSIEPWQNTFKRKREGLMVWVLLSYSTCFIAESTISSKIQDWTKSGHHSGRMFHAHRLLRWITLAAERSGLITKMLQASLTMMFSTKKDARYLCQSRPVLQTHRSARRTNTWRDLADGQDIEKTRSFRPCGEEIPRRVQGLQLFSILFHPWHEKKH